MVSSLSITAATQTQQQIANPFQQDQNNQNQTSRTQDQAQQTGQPAETQTTQAGTPATQTQGTTNTGNQLQQNTSFSEGLSASGGNETQGQQERGSILDISI